MQRFVELSTKGCTRRVPAVAIGDRTIVITGRWVRTARIYDEDWCDGDLKQPHSMIEELRRHGVHADLFTFGQKVSNTQRQHDYFMEWENVAAVPITNFNEWWEQRVPQETRKNVRRAGRRGVIVKRVEFDDMLIEGLKQIYDESPVRQGRRFWHYGKNLATIKKENASYVDRSYLVGAFYNVELIGFLKMVQVGTIANVMQIVCKAAHADKRPMNALIAKAVEICAENQLEYFVYGQYVYGRHNAGQLTEFKRRNGFEQFLTPRYYVPLTLRGRIVLKLRIHDGVRRFLPSVMESGLLALRSHYLRWKEGTEQPLAQEKEGC